MRAWILLGVAVSLLAPGSTLAQGSRYGGYWGSLGVGVGQRIISESSETEWATGGTFYVRMGATVSDRFLVGAEVELWSKDENQVMTTRTNATLNGIFFPSPILGLFVKGGVGGAIVRAADVSSLPSSSSVWRYGMAATLGVGYDIPVGEALSLTPNLDFMYQWLNDFDVSDAAFISLTIGVTWH